MYNRRNSVFFCCPYNIVLCKQRPNIKVNALDGFMILFNEFCSMFTKAVAFI